MSAKAKQAVIAHHESSDIKLRSYIVGFAGSVTLTLAAYFLVVNDSLPRVALIWVIIILALAQFTVQLIYFLHLGAERKPRWKFLVFSFMVSIVLILVVGTIWIMNNLNYHMLDEHDLLHHMKVDEGL